MGLFQRLAGLCLLAVLSSCVSCSTSSPYLFPVSRAYLVMPLPRPANRPRCPSHHPPSELSPALKPEPVD